jgi:hypothetical protein
MAPEQSRYGPFHAVFWVQGEQDYDEGTTAETYAAKLTSVIGKSRVIQPGLPWYVAINSNTINGNGARTGQQAVVMAGTALGGPDLDVLRLATDTDEGMIHFTNATGIRTMGESWLTIARSLRP